VRFSRRRHVHDIHPRTVRSIDVDWVEECSCGRRRLGRLGWGTESGTYFSRWYDVTEVDKLQRLFPERFSVTWTPKKDEKSGREEE